MIMRFPLLLCLLAMSCSAAREEPANDGASSSSGSLSSSGSDGAPNGNGPRWEWQENAAPKKRDHHATFAVESQGTHYLYVVGGKSGNSTPVTTVERARVLDDGTLEPWTDMGELPVLMGPTLAQHPNAIVLIGGVRMEEGKRVTSNATDLVQVQSDGTLTLASGPSLHVPRFHATTAVVGDFVFVLGGFPDNKEFEATASVERARVSQGTLSAFEEVRPLPDALVHHASVAHRSGIYLVSGTGMNSGPTTHVWYASVDEVGALSEWRVVGDLPATRGTHAVNIVGDKLVVAGGMDDPYDMTPEPDIFAASVHDDGSLDAFEVVATMEVPRMHLHQAPLVGSALYLVAGATHDHESDTLVSVARADALRIVW